jgi:hypothetical protein
VEHLRRDDVPHTNGEIIISITKMLILGSNTHLFAVSTAFSAASTQLISMQEVQAAGTAVGFAQQWCM